MKRLIVNADDFGMSPGISRGILEAHHKGIVTSTTVMIGYPDAPSNLAAGINDAPDLGFGLHITLTGGGPPVSPVHTIPTLLNDEGTFPGIEYWLRHLELINPAELELEVRAQFDRFVQTVGRFPDHLDCHHGCLYQMTAGQTLLLALANEHDLPIRKGEGLTARQPDHFVDSFYDTTATLGDLLLALTTLKEGTSELMCHPGYAEADLIDIYREPRAAEVKALTHPSTREVIKAEGIVLIKFSDLATSGETA